MNFKLVLEKLLTAFEKHEVRYALIGGFALGAWGAPRGTVDIESLMALKGKELNWQLIEEYFSLFGFHELFNNLKGRYYVD